MKWNVAELIGIEESGTDKLGNATTSEATIANVLVRPTPNDPALVSNDGNAYTSLIRTFTTTAPYDIVRRCRVLVIEDKRYDVKSTDDVGRMRLIVAEAVKQP